MPALTTSQDGVSASFNRYCPHSSRPPRTKFNYTHTRLQQKEKRKWKHERIKITRTRGIYSVALSSTATKVYSLLGLHGRLSCPSVTWSNNASSAGKRAIPLQALTGPKGSRRLRLPHFKTIVTRRWQRLSALRTGRLYPPRKYSWHSFLFEAESTPGS
jgi:hypothetical protein